MWGDNVGERRAGPQWWSLQPLRTVTPPALASIPNAWSQSSIDRFILTKLRRSGLEPSKPAGLRELIRRVTFDVTGLPPTPIEVDAFVKDPPPANAGDGTGSMLRAFPTAEGSSVTWFASTLGAIEIT